MCGKFGIGWLWFSKNDCLSIMVLLNSVLIESLEWTEFKLEYMHLFLPYRTGRSCLNLVFLEGAFHKSYVIGGDAWLNSINVIAIGASMYSDRWFNPNRNG